MNKEDIFKEKLKSVFNDFEAPVPLDGWENMEQSLNAAARAKIVRRNWYIGSAAATLAILIGSLFFLRSPKSLEQEIPTLTEATVPDQSESAEKQDIQTAKTEQAVKIGESGQSKQPRQKQEILIAKQTERKETTKPIFSETIEQTDEIRAIAQQSEQAKEFVIEDKSTKQEDEGTKMSQDEIDRLIQEFANAGNTELFSGFDEKEKRSPIMLALNGKGGLSSSQKIANAPMTLRSAGSEKSDEAPGDSYFLGNSGKNDLTAGYDKMTPLTSLNAANNVAELEHAQPFSVGITVSKNIIDRLSIETGLVYTYLHSKAKNTSSDFQNKETQHFHYLGIPLNFNYELLNFGGLGVYASLGGMAEKDISGEHRNAGEMVSSELNTSAQGVVTRKISQKNPQFSVNAGLGVTYPIYGGFNLYGKVGGSYYFDAKNDYKTIYSDKKIVLDLNAGIRFDF